MSSSQIIVDRTLTTETATSFKTITAALASAKDGDQIFIKEGEYHEPLFVINKNIIIIGQNDENQTKKTQIHVNTIQLLGSPETGVTIKNIAIFCLYDPGIAIYRGRHNIENCQIVFQSTKASIRIKHGSHAFLKGNVFRAQITHQSRATAWWFGSSIEEHEFDPPVIIEQNGNAILTDNVFEKFNNCAIEIQDKGTSTIIGNRISDCPRGITISEGASAEIELNTITACPTAIYIDNDTKVTVKKNTITFAVLGVEILGTCELEITENTISHVVGPAVNIFSMDRAMIKNNNFSVGKTVAIRMEKTKGVVRDAIERGNNFSGFPMGSISTADNIVDAILATIDELLTTVNLTPTTLGQRLKDSSYGTQISKLCKTLQRYPDIFSVTNECVTWSDNLLAFPEPAPLKSDNNNNNNASPSKQKRKDWSKHAKKIFDRTGGLCYLCRKPMKFENRQDGQESAWHIEHVMPFSKYPELDNLENLLAAHIKCDSCKGANHLQSIVNEADFDLLTLNIASLHPRVAKEMKEAKERYKGQYPKQPKLLEPNHFSFQVSPSDNAQAITNGNRKPKDNNGNTKQQFHLEQKFVIPYSNLKISEEKLGEGSFSTVWKAKYNGTPVAAKKIINVSMEFSEDFQKEVSILSKLRHPHIILLMGVCTPPDPCVIVTELFEKGSLQHVLDSKEAINEKQRLGFALDVARGMCYLHNIKILHLDLKPLNIMVDNSGSCKIADFGLSKVLSLGSNGSHYATNKGLVGTVIYMAPELLAESTAIDLKADVYSYGIILWQIFTRAIPYSKMSAFNIMKEVLEKKNRPKIPLQCLFAYGSLMSKCWEHNPVDRPTFDNVVEILEELLQLVQKEA